MKQSIKIFVLVIFVSCLYFSQEKTKCADDLKLDTCYVYGKEGETSVTYVKACSKGKVCETDEGVGTCVKYKRKLEEGKKCESNVECLSGICKDKKCSVLKDGDTCESRDECGLSSYCKSSNGEKKCAPLGGQGDYCINENDCKIGFDCNDQLSQCVEMFTGTNGYESRNPLICQSGTAHNYKEENNNYKWICATYTAVRETCEGTDNSKTCKVSVNYGNTTKEEEINCPKNWNDEYICPTKQTQYFEKYKKAFKEKINDLSDDDKKNKYISRKHFYKKEVQEAYADYYYYDASDPNNDCIRDYYIREASSNFFSISMLLLTTFFLIVV